MNYTDMILEKYQLISKIPGIEIHDFLIRDKCDESELKQVAETLRQKIPDDLLDFYSQTNGFKFSWSYSKEDVKLYGFCNIVDLYTSIYGYDRKDNVIKENRFEDIFWNDSFPSEVVQNLKKHYLLESFDGESENTTFIMEDNNVQLFDIYEDQVSLYSITLCDYLTGVITWGGIFTLREEFLKKESVPKLPFNDESSLFFKLSGNKL